MPESDRDKLVRLAMEHQRARQKEQKKQEDDLARRRREFEQKSALTTERNEELKKWCEDVFLGHTLCPKAGYTIQKVEIASEVPALGIASDKYPNEPWIYLIVPCMVGGVEKQIPIFAVRYSIEGCYDAARSMAVRSIHDYQVAKNEMIEMVASMDEEYVTRLAEWCARGYDMRR